MGIFITGLWKLARRQVSADRLSFDGLKQEFSKNPIKTEGVGGYLQRKM